MLIEKTNIRGRHAAPDIDSDGERIVIRPLLTRISQDTVTVKFSPCENTVCVRLDDKTHSDFWVEFNLDVATLEKMLKAAQSGVSDELSEV